MSHMKQVQCTMYVPPQYTIVCTIHAQYTPCRLYCTYVTVHTMQAVLSICHSTRHAGCTVHMSQYTPCRLYCTYVTVHTMQAVLYICHSTHHAGCPYVTVHASMRIMSSGIALLIHVQVCSAIETRQSKPTMRQDNSSFSKSYLRQDLNHVLRTRQTLYQLSHRGSSAGQAESLNVFKGKVVSSLMNRATHFSTVACTHSVNYRHRRWPPNCAPYSGKGILATQGKTMDATMRSPWRPTTPPPPHTHIHTLTTYACTRAHLWECLSGPMAVGANACRGQWLYCMYICFV